MAAPTAAYVASRRAFLRTLLIGGATAAALPLLQEPARADLFMPSVADQKKLGQQAAAEVFQKYQEVKDERARVFNSVGSHLVNALTGNDRQWDYSFHVIESKEINAFAVPGGNMFLFTGLMSRMHSADEMAAVTGHELTHVRRQHWAKATASRTKRELGLQILLNVAHAGGGWQQIAGLGDTLLSLRYSRGEEDEADAGGLQNMVAAGYDPHGMLDLFNTLLQATGGKENGPGFLSDHPLTQERIKKTQQRIAKLER